MEEGVDEELFCRGIMGLAFEMAAKASAAWKKVMCILELPVWFNSIQKPRDLGLDEDLVDEPRALHDSQVRLLVWIAIGFRPPQSNDPALQGGYHEL